MRAMVSMPYQVFAHAMACGWTVSDALDAAAEEQRRVGVTGAASGYDLVAAVTELLDVDVITAALGHTRRTAARELARTGRADLGRLLLACPQKRRLR